MPKLAAALAALVLTVACAESEPSEPNPAPPASDDVVADGVWTLESGHSASGEIGIGLGHDITLEITGDKARGSAGCNAYGGGVSIDGSSFDAGEFAMSEIACPPRVEEAEQRYLDAMEAAETIDVSGKTLTLTGPEAHLVFRRVPPIDTKPLTKTAWVLESLVDGDSVSSTVAGAKPAHLELSRDGTFDGTTGCRRFTGSWTTSGDVVRITQMVFSGTCKKADEQDAHVAAVIATGFRANVTGDRLELTSDKDDLGLVYRAR